MDSTSLRKQLTKNDEQITQRVFCSLGHHYMPSKGGVYKTTADGRTRFICAACTKTALERRKTK